MVLVAPVAVVTFIFVVLEEPGLTVELELLVFDPFVVELPVVV